MRQQIYLEERFAYKLPDGSSLFWLQDPIVLPNQVSQFTISVPHASIPLTHYVITERNNTLELVIDGVPHITNLKVGNHSIDEVIKQLESTLEGVEIAYDQTTNTVSFSAPVSLAVGSRTTAQTLLGVRTGDVSQAGVYTGPGGVNLAGPSSVFIRSNLRTKNRDPVGLGFSNLLAKVSIDRSFNAIQKYDAPQYSYTISDRSIHFIVIQILDDDMNPLEFHGGHWSLTLEFNVVPAETYTPAQSYQNDIMNMLSNGQERGAAESAPAGQRKDPDSRGPDRNPAGNPGG